MFSRAQVKVKSQSYINEITTITLKRATPVPCDHSLEAPAALYAGLRWSWVCTYYVNDFLIMLMLK